jgi:hypothetical protein
MEAVILLIKIFFEQYSMAFQEEEVDMALALR